LGQRNPPIHGAPRATVRQSHETGDIMLWTILGLIVIGLIAGLIARAVIPGKQSMGILLTIVLGIVGSFVGGFLGFLLFGADPNGGFLQPAGIIGSILGAIIVLGLYVLFTRRRTSRTP
jgi:uncharacterized membrane protein YeaQ/YmgE (transglycosylase-associated protein family)